MILRNAQGITAIVAGGILPVARGSSPRLLPPGIPIYTPGTIFNPDKPPVQGISAGGNLKRRCYLETRAIRVIRSGDSVKAYIVVYVKGCDEELTYRIKYPRCSQPFYIADGARHDLTEKQIEKLKSLIKEVESGR